MQAKTIFSDPVPLPDGPLLTRWLFEEPITPVVLLGLAAIVVASVLWRGAKFKAAGLSLLALGGLAGVVLLVANLVETERERMVVRAASLVRSVAAADGNAVDAALADAVAIEVLGSRSSRGKAAILAEIRSDVAGRYNAKAPEVGRVTASMDGDNSCRTRIKVAFSSLGGESGTVNTTWLLHWRRDGSGAWKVWTIEAEQIGLLPQGSVRW